MTREALGRAPARWATTGARAGLPGVSRRAYDADMITGLKVKLDYDDYAQIPPDRNRYEILEGELYVTPAPSPLHQRVSKRLQRMLEAYFETRGLGEVFNAPVDLILTHHDVVQPDLVVVTDPGQVSARGIEGGA